LENIGESRRIKKVVIERSTI